MKKIVGFVVGICMILVNVSPVFAVNYSDGRFVRNEEVIKILEKSAFEGINFKTLKMLTKKRFVDKERILYSVFADLSGKVTKVKFQVLLAKKDKFFTEDVRYYKLYYIDWTFNVDFSISEIVNKLLLDNKFDETTFNSIVALATGCHEEKYPKEFEKICNLDEKTPDELLKSNIGFSAFDLSPCYYIPFEHLSFLQLNSNEKVLVRVVN